MMFHVQLSGKGFSLNSAVEFNQTKENVERKFAKPWGNGDIIVVQGKPFDPHDSEIRVYEFDELTDDESKNALGWTKVAMEGREVTGQFITFAPGAQARGGPGKATDADPRGVAVIYGRDQEAKEWLFDFLRALDLRPLEWMHLVRATGSAAPFNRDVIDGLFTRASAAIVLLTPDEECRLHPELVPELDLKGDSSWRGQPRSNVLLEAGMALALRPDRTIFVQIGPVDIPSDIDGMSRVHIDGTAKPLFDLASRLEDAQCAVKRDGSDWLDVARLERLTALKRLPSSKG